MPNKKLETIFTLFGIVLLIAGSLLVSLDFLFPQETIIYHHQPVNSLHESSANTISISNVTINPDYWDRLNLTNPGYWYFNPVYVTPNQTITVSWYSDIKLGVYIFSQEQFMSFQSKFQSASAGLVNNVGDAATWANNSGFVFETAKTGSKNAEVVYPVTHSGSYVSVITNGMYGAQENGSGASAGISYFNESIVYYSDEARYFSSFGDLYLCLGAFLIIGGISTLYFLRKQNTESL